LHQRHRHWFVALGYAKVAVLSVVQGITELMPISSTAHMRIVLRCSAGKIPARLSQPRGSSPRSPR
jgi:hypothetical protein